MDFKCGWSDETVIRERTGSYVGNSLERQMPVAEHKKLYNGPVMKQGQQLRTDLLHTKGHGSPHKAFGVSRARGRTSLKKTRRAFLGV